MKLLGNYWQREGKGTTAPASGWPRAGAMALTHFWKLIAANILFVIFSLPVITLPAALTALDRVCVIIFRDGNIFLWHEFRKEFCRSFTRTLLPGSCFALLLFGGYFFMSMGNGNPGLGVITLLFWSIGILMTMTALLVGEIFFIMISVLEIRNTDALKNAVILSMAKPGYSLAILLIIVLLLTSAAALMPVLGSVLLFFIWIVLAQYPICYMVYDLIDRMILTPFEEQQADSAEEKP